MTDVLISGAGPTGLLLAGDLAAAGVFVKILERRAGEFNLLLAFALHARALRDAALAAASRMPAARNSIALWVTGLKRSPLRHDLPPVTRATLTS
jgi:2-polyprenyl-6-methoxyphenol hydroxylase-like FAD-dependent oxidoreductase